MISIAHVVNVLLHLLNVLLIALLVRGVLRLPYFAGQFADVAGAIALVVALVWAVHPLVTEAVEYVTQRTELMACLFYLATLYASLRYWERGAARWLAAGVTTRSRATGWGAVGVTRSPLSVKLPHGFSNRNSVQPSARQGATA